MIRNIHEFHNGNIVGDGNIYKIGVKTNANLTMVVSIGGDADTNGVQVSFYGKGLAEGSGFLPIKAFDNNELKFSTTGVINKTYSIDVLSFSEIKITLDAITDGNVRVVGEVID